MISILWNRFTRATPSMRVLRISQLMLVLSLLMPAVDSTTLGPASRPTWGLEIFISMPLLFVPSVALLASDGSVTTLLLAAYTAAMVAANVIALCGGRLCDTAARAPHAVAWVLFATAVAASPLFGVPNALGVHVENLRLGYYLWFGSFGALTLAVLVKAVASRMQTVTGLTRDGTDGA